MSAGPPSPAAPGPGGPSPRAGRPVSEFLLKAAVSLGLLALVVWTQDVGGVLRLMVAADPWLLLAATVAMLAEQSLTAVTWWLLLLGRRLGIGIGRVFHVYYLSFFFGTWLPSSSGPDVLRAYYLARHVDGYESVGSMLVLRFVGLLTLGLMAVGVIHLMPSTLPPAAVVLAWLLTLGSAGALAVGFTERPRRWAVAILERLHLQRLASVLSSLHAGLHGFGRARGHLAAAIVLSVVAQVLRVLTHWFAALAMDVDVPFRHFLVLVPVTFIFVMVPVSIAGLGVREGSFVYFFGRVGMSEAEAFGLGLLLFGLTLALWLMAAVLYWVAPPPRRERATSSSTDGPSGE